MWKTVIQANSLMNNIPIVVINRIGVEKDSTRKIHFWGNSFITNADGYIVKEAKGSSEVLRHTFDIIDRQKSIKKWNF